LFRPDSNSSWRNISVAGHTRSKPPPNATLLLPEQPNRWIPGAVLAVEKPTKAALLRRASFANISAR
jgi:hypothetical protein